MDAHSLAEDMLAECASVGQSARRVPGGAAEGLRSELRAGARLRRMRIRTALLDGVVVAARLDAELWDDDTATMRAKLSPPA